MWSNTFRVNLGGSLRGDVLVGRTKVYIVCPRVRTGGPENQHHLCDYLNVLGAEAYIYYQPNEDRDYDLLYPEFTNARVCEQIEDSTDTVIVIPEICRIRDFRNSFPNSTIAVHWLSYTNAALFGSLRANIVDEANAIHLFQSYYEYVMVRPHLSWGTWWFFVTDCISDEYLALDPRAYIPGKQDMLCFNGNKDKITQNICGFAGITCTAISGMPKAEVMEVLQRSKVYVDMGYHPGKDRLPREAAMHGCVVVTNMSGSAAYIEDVPIEEKVRFESDLYGLIPKIFAGYEHYFTRQQTYRDVIRGEKEIFRENVEGFWREISTRPS